MNTCLRCDAPLRVTNEGVCRLCDVQMMPVEARLQSIFNYIEPKLYAEWRKVEHRAAGYPQLKMQVMSTMMHTYFHAHRKLDADRNYIPETFGTYKGFLNYFTRPTHTIPYLDSVVDNLVEQGCVERKGDKLWIHDHIPECDF